MTTVVITGASAGVGRAVARAFAEQGANIALIARGREGLEAAAKEVNAAGGTAMAIPLDVADARAVDEAAERIEKQFGPIDVWVNNAMVSVFSPVHQLTADEVRRVTEVTYLGYVHGTLSALSRMRARNRGVIVQVGSALAYRGIPGQAAYCGAKHAIKGFTESLRCELLGEDSNVRVTQVQLPAVNTPQFGWVRSRLPGKPQPVPPIFQPEVVARAVLHAAEHAPREIKVGWSAARAIYLEKLVPGLADRYLARKGLDAQQLDEPADPRRRDNVFEALPGDRGAHGTFDSEAKSRSLHLTARIALGEAFSKLRPAR